MKPTAISLQQIRQRTVQMVRHLNYKVDLEKAIRCTQSNGWIGRCDLLLEEGQQATVELVPDDIGWTWHRKAEVGFTENIEQLLESLQAPLSIVHTVNPREAAQCFDRWLPSLEKEVRSLEHAVERVSSHEEQVGAGSSIWSRTDDTDESGVYCQTS